LKKGGSMLFDKYQIFDIGFGGSVKCPKDSEIGKKLMALLDSGEEHELTFDDLRFFSKIKVTNCYLDSEKRADFTLTFPKWEEYVAKK